VSAHQCNLSGRRTARAGQQRAGRAAHRPARRNPVRHRNQRRLIAPSQQRRSRRLAIGRAADHDRQPARLIRRLWHRRPRGRLRRAVHEQRRRTDSFQAEGRAVGSDTFAMLDGTSSSGAPERDNQDSPYLRGGWRRFGQDLPSSEATVPESSCVGIALVRFGASSSRKALAYFPRKKSGSMRGQVRPV
jgi:hypothetical protein